MATILGCKQSIICRVEMNMAPIPRASLQKALSLGIPIDVVQMYCMEFPRHKPTSKAKNA
jgi:hypothetical protein